MNKINYHTHTKLCRHAGGDELDYVKSAIANGLSTLGFSEHAPYKDDHFELRMLYCELDSYAQRVRQLQKLYKDKLAIYLGLEIEFDPRLYRYYEELLVEKEFDYLILGQHMYINSNQDPINIYFIEESKDTSLYIEYAYSLKEGMETGFFKVLAHPDVIFINDLAWDENCDKACDIIIQAARDTGTIVELNANGIRRQEKEYCDGIRFPYPHPGFWSKLSGSSVPVIISSDCHNPTKLWDECMDQAYELAAQWNLNVVDTIFLQ